MEEGPSLGIVGRNYPITLDLTIFESGPHEPAPNLVEVRWDTTEPPPVDKVLVRSSLLSEPLVLIPANPQ